MGSRLLEPEDLSPQTPRGHALRGKRQKLRRVRRLGKVLLRGMSLLARGRLPVFGRANDAYEQWRQRRRLTEADRQRMRAEAAAMKDPPLVSVLMPVTPEPYLRLAIESVLRQTYPYWELCVAGDASSAPHVRPVVEESARRDARIKVTWRSQHGNATAAFNSALELAQGEYIAPLGHDDELAEHALFEVARSVAADRRLDMIYSDEDKLEPDGRHVEPFFKPDWSPEYFEACMYTGRLAVYRTALVRELGGFRSAFDTAPEYDLALRVVARSANVAHIPDILYHGRKSPKSGAADNSARPHADDAARRALEDYLRASGRKSTVEPGPVSGSYRVRTAIEGRPLVSIVIPTACRPVVLDGRETTFVAACLQSLCTRSTYPRYEIIVVDDGDMPPELQRELGRWPARRLSYTAEFNFSAKINRGAAHARGDFLVLLNDDVTIISPDWLECMLEYAQRPEIGAVGAKLFFPDGQLQHAGVTLPGFNPGHPFYGYPGDFPGYFGGSLVPRNYSAVTGACLMTRREVFEEVGGFTEALPVNYNDVDFCLKVIRGGRRVVYTPYAQLHHHESVSKAGVFRHELDAFRERWRHQWQRDLYYNPNLTSRFHDYRIDPDAGGR